MIHASQSTKHWLRRLSSATLSVRLELYAAVMTVTSGDPMLDYRESLADCVYALASYLCSELKSNGITSFFSGKRYLSGSACRYGWLGRLKKSASVVPT